MNDVTYTKVEFLSRTLEKYTFVSKACTYKTILLQQKNWIVNKQSVAYCTV